MLKPRHLGIVLRGLIFPCLVAFAWFGVSASPSSSNDLDVGAALSADTATESRRTKQAEVRRPDRTITTALTADWNTTSDKPNSWFGVSVATAGDVNGDGYDDLIVGAPLYDNEGRVFVYYGARTGPGKAASWMAAGDQAGARFGSYVGSAGDVNGDGYADIVVAAEMYDRGEQDEGRAFVYYGSATGLDARNTRPQGLPSNADWTFESDQTGALCRSVATAGDVNGDGYADLIVGSHMYNGAHGRAWVFHGSSSGLSRAPDWTVDGSQAKARFGFSASTAGDVNGDRYSDVIIGAFFHDNGQVDEGRAFVYYGSSNGLSRAVNWSAESDQPGALFGRSVGTAGDVNGDGYADVIVGALFYTNGESKAGRAFVYHGSATGLDAGGTRPSGTPDVANWTAEGDQAGADFASSVATARDVNGDGYDDVVVGAWHHPTGGENAGRLFLYEGSATGLSARANGTASAGQAGALFGVSVGSAGDVDGDGFADLIAGAYRYGDLQRGQGRAFVYRGYAPASRPGGQLASGGGARRLSKLTLSNVLYRSLYSAVIDTARGYAYFATAGGTHVNPGWVIKVDLKSAAPREVGAVACQPGEYNLVSGVIDPDHGYAYFGTATTPGRVIKIALGTGNSAPRYVGAIALNPGENGVLGAVADLANGYAYFGTNTPGGGVVKVALGAGDALPSRVSSVTLSPGEDRIRIRRAVVDPARGYAYFATLGRSTPMVIKVALGRGSTPPVRVGAATLDAAELNIGSAVIDADNGYAYFGTYSPAVVPARVVKVALGQGDQPPRRVGALTLEAGERELSTAVIDPVAGYAYFGSDHTHPAKIYQIALGQGDAVPIEAAVLQLEPGTEGYTVPDGRNITSANPEKHGELYLQSSVIDVKRGYAYFGTDTAPGQVVKVRLPRSSIGTIWKTAQPKPPL